MADSIPPETGSQSSAGSAHAPSAGRPRALVIASEATWRRIEPALAEAFDVVAATGETAGVVDGALAKGVDVVVLEAGASGGSAVIGRIGDDDLDGVPVLAVSDAAVDISPEELRAGARSLAGLKRARDVLRAEVQSPHGDLESLARQLSAERRSAEDALRKAEASNRGKDEFLAILAHELRTPLNAVLGWASLLRREGVTEADLQRGLEVIDRNARAQARLIEDVLDVSAVILRKVQVRREPIALGAVLSEALDAVRPTAEAKGIDLACEWVPGDPVVLGDAERLVQAVHNLVGNAVKFTPEGGHVTVRTRLAGGAVVLEVEDTGIGIAPELLPHIFEQFTQGASRGEGRSRGLGLGLAIARHLIELHEGAIEAASPGEGRGTIFTVRLPLVESSRPAPVEHAR